MSSQNNEKLLLGMKNAFVDRKISAVPAFTPQFVYNDNKHGKKVLCSIEDELRSCEEFSISAAFITKGGITPLLVTLKELEKKGVRGRVLTTDYLNFSEPEALRKLNSLSNITLKMYCASEKEGMHTKGYIFKKDEVYKMIIGSSNVTSKALTINKEWNTKLVSTSNGQVIRDALNQFDNMWNDKKTKNYEDFIQEYQTKYEIIKKQRAIATKQEVPLLDAYRLEPNKMQVGFVSNLKKITEEGNTKALLISATGTGKTYASAFAARELEYKRVLFLVHRNQIARQALQSYKRVFGTGISLGLVTGKKQQYDADFIFATIQTMSKQENLHRFAQEHFDLIIVDEAHHSSAKSYKRIMDYFKPVLWIGMTATPDKRDDNIEGENIYELFNHQIACEIRLQDAMEEDMLCPFHYFGITDLEMISDGNNQESEGTKLIDFKYLTSDQRVNHVLKQAEYYGYSGERVKGLMFCSRIDEARELSKKFNCKGLRTVVLCGDDSEETRRSAIERLAGDDNDNALDYILSVDIFSEGVDVPEINQVIMLRPTQSPIVFIQQLGRGLRKSIGKEYVVVLDFIGNYSNNFMIPIALSGDRSYNKDNVRRYVVEGGRVIPGASTVHFDEISRKRIFQSIDNANFSDIKLIKENYLNLKNKLGYIPTLMDFDRYGEMDVLRIFDNKSLGSYYKFLEKYEKEYTVRLSKDEEKVIEFISKKLANGKRIHELELLNRALSYQHGLISLLNSTLREKYNITMDSNCKQSVINVMTNTFPTGSGRTTYKQCIFLQEDNDKSDFSISFDFQKMLSNPDFYNMVKELVEFGINRFHRDYSSRYQDTNLVLYQKYTYEDACRLLNWENNEVPLNIGGYKFDKKTNTFPVFINYDKMDDISDTTKYEDHFTSEGSLIAISKSGRSIQSEDVQNFLNAKERGIDVQLFVRKNKDDKISKEFYYLGRMTASGWKREFTMPNTDKKAVEIQWILDTPVREDIYEYIVNG